MVSVKIKPTIIGLTGGIGTGKSTVSDYIKKKGYKVIDADKISHEITEKGSPLLDKLASVFGNAIILTDGSLDRKKLAEIAFSNTSSKEKLEYIVTNEVISIIASQVQQLKQDSKDKLVFVDAPLLFETDAHKLTDYNWTVVCDREVQISRAMERDNATQDEIEARISNQMSTDEKIRLSNESIDNSTSLEDLYLQIEGLINKYEK